MDDAAEEAISADGKALLRAQQELQVLHVEKEDGTLRYEWIRRGDLLASLLADAGMVAAGGMSPLASPMPWDAFASTRSAGGYAGGDVAALQLALAAHGTAPGLPLEFTQAATLPPVTGRDLRVIDAANVDSDGHTAAVLVRQGAIIVTMPTVRALLTARKAYFILEDGADEKLAPLLMRLQALEGIMRARHGQGAAGDSTASPPADGSDADAAGFVPFDLYVLESIFITVCENLSAELAAMQLAVTKLVRALGGRDAHNPKHMGHAREMKHTLGTSNNALAALHRVLTNLLDSPEDLAGLLVEPDAVFTGGDSTRKIDNQEHSQASAALPATAEAGQEVATARSYAALDEGANEVIDGSHAAEVLVEFYVAQIYALLSKAQRGLADIESAEQHAMLMLSNSRNDLWRWQILLSAFTFALSCMGLVGGYFGMNLGNAVKHGVADNFSVFLVTTIVSSMAGLALLGCTAVMLR